MNERCAEMDKMLLQRLSAMSRGNLEQSYANQPSPHPTVRNLTLLLVCAAMRSLLLTGSVLFVDCSRNLTQGCKYFKWSVTSFSYQRSFRKTGTIGTLASSGNWYLVQVPGALLLGTGYYHRKKNLRSYMQTAAMRHFMPENGSQCCP